MDHLRQVVRSHTNPPRYIAVINESNYFWTDDINRATVFTDIDASMSWCRAHGVDGKEIYLSTLNRNQTKKVEEEKLESAKKQTRASKQLNLKKSFADFETMRIKMYKVLDRINADEMTDAEKELKSILDDYNKQGK